jgi:hypothetical protein
MRLGSFAYVALAALCGCGEVAGTVKLSETAAITTRSGKLEKTCTAVTAMATGFGEQNVTRLADGNLALAIDKAKDEMASEGAKGFTVEARTVKCAFYIDFGGLVGREHKCRASAELCGRRG